MDRLNLRPGLVEDWLHLGLLIRGQIQIFGQVLERIAAPRVAMTMPFGIVRLDRNNTAERESARDDKSSDFRFHCL